MRLDLHVLALAFAACSPARGGGAPRPVAAPDPLPATSVSATAPDAALAGDADSPANLFVAPVSEVGVALDLAAWPSDPPPEIALRACRPRAANEKGWLVLRVIDRGQAIEASVVDSAGLTPPTIDCFRRTLAATPLASDRGIVSVLLYVALR